MKNKPQNNPQKKVTKRFVEYQSPNVRSIEVKFLVDAFTFTKHKKSAICRMWFRIISTDISYNHNNLNSLHLMRDKKPHKRA